MTSNNTLNSQIEETKHDFNSITNDFKNLTTSSNTVTDAIKQIQATLKGIKEAKNDYEKFKDDFGKTIASLGDAFAQYNQIVPISKEFTPTKANLDDVIKELATKSHIVVLTGAGLSAASNIPTFRGEGGYWTLRNKQEKLKATDFLTHEYFVSEQSATEEVWRWHHELKRLVAKNTPNISHTALAELQHFCKKFEINFSLITQNVDGYHVEAYVRALEKAQKQPTSKTAPDMQKKQIDKKKAKTTTTSKNINTKSVEEKPVPRFTVPANLMNKYGIFNDVYEIHGNIYYMRCDNDCTTSLFAAPEVGCADNFVPKCPNCQGTARPHTLFFDESYEEEYYRGQSLMKQINSMDCLLVVGTALETYLACKIVNEAVKSNKLIIEVNPQPRIQNGNVKHFIGNAEEFIPTLCEGYQKIKTESARSKK